MVVWYPANHQTHPATPRQPPCNTQKPTSVCVHTSFGACVHVSGFLKFLPRPQATSPHSPMHPETPIDPFTWKERPTPTGQIETSIESKLSVCQKSFSMYRKVNNRSFIWRITNASTVFLKEVMGCTNKYYIFNGTYCSFLNIYFQQFFIFIHFIFIQSIHLIYSIN